MTRSNLINDIADVYVPFRLMHARPDAARRRPLPAPRKTSASLGRFGVRSIGVVAVVAVALVTLTAV